jgi:hypothetical protein
MSRRVIITVDRFPSGADDHNVAEYVERALATYGGSLHPGDPMCDCLSVTQVRIGEKVYRPEK